MIVDDPMTIVGEGMRSVKVVLDWLGVAPFGLMAASYWWLFGKARDFSPGTGLAIGYYENFLGPVLRGMRADGRPWGVSLWIPPAGDWSSSRSEFDGMTTAKGPGQEYLNQAVDTDQGKRTILIADRDGKRHALDLPRTLTPVLDRLMEVPAGKALRWLGTKDALQRRELRNFWEELLRRIREDAFETNVKVFCGASVSAESTASDLTGCEAMLDAAIPKPARPLRWLGF
jgi:hypothetical protein